MCCNGMGQLLTIYSKTAVQVAELWWYRLYLVKQNLENKGPIEDKDILLDSLQKKKKKEILTKDILKWIRVTHVCSVMVENFMMQTEMIARIGVALA